MSDFKPDLVITNDMSPSMQGNISLLNKYVKGLSFSSQNIKVYYKEPSADETGALVSTSATYELLPQMTINFSMSNPGYILIDGSMSGNTVGVGYIFYLVINLNGSNLVNTERSACSAIATANATIPVFWAGRIGAGNHVAQLFWKSTAGSNSNALVKDRAIRVITIEDANGV